MEDLTDFSLLMGYVRRTLGLAQEIKACDGAEAYLLLSSTVLSCIVTALTPVLGNCIRKATEIISEWSG